MIHRLKALTALKFSSLFENHLYPFGFTYGIYHCLLIANQEIYDLIIKYLIFERKNLMLLFSIANHFLCSLFLLKESLDYSIVFKSIRQ